MKIHIINGPNLNLLGEREVGIYGNQSFDSFIDELKNHFPEVQITYFQSNVEGNIIDEIQAKRNGLDGIIINPGGYSHTSVAIADALATVSCPIIEVHLSNLYKRESYRHQSITGSKCLGVISGLGLQGYKLAIDYLFQAK